MNYRKLWEDAFGPIPVDEQGRSYEIHHIDGDRTNNVLTNLKCISAEEHWQIHLEQGDYNAATLIGKRLNKPPLKEFQGPRKGSKLSESHKQALINSRIGYKASEETKKKISEKNKGRIPTEEHKRKNSEWHLGKKLSEETKRKMSEARTGKPSGTKGQKKTEEHIRKIQESRKITLLLKKQKQGITQ